MVFELYTEPVRIVGIYNQRNSFAGRVEVWINGAWATVCSYVWGLSDAIVVCRQLGYQYALSAPLFAAYGAGSGPIWLTDVACLGNESSILNCTRLDIGVYRYFCGYYDDASAVCYKGKHCIYLVSCCCFVCTLPHTLHQLCL